jgi:hypothetical protein
LSTLCGFEGSGLKTLEVPATTEYILEDAFAGCVLLASLRFGSNLVTREIDGFGAWGLMKITIPAMVRGIKSNGFAECQVLQTLSFETRGRL